MSQYAITTLYSVIEQRFGMSLYYIFDRISRKTTIRKLYYRKLNDNDEIIIIIIMIIIIIITRRAVSRAKSQNLSSLLALIFVNFS